MAFSDEWKVIDACEHGIAFDRYCPWCWQWEKRIREEAARLRQERERLNRPK